MLAAVGSRSVLDMMTPFDSYPVAKTKQEKVSLKFRSFLTIYGHHDNLLNINTHYTA